MESFLSGSAWEPAVEHHASTPFWSLSQSSGSQAWGWRGGGGVSSATFWLFILLNMARCAPSYHYSDFQTRPSCPNHQLPRENQKPLATGQQSCHPVPHFKAHLSGSGVTTRWLWLSHQPRGQDTRVSIYDHTKPAATMVAALAEMSWIRLLCSDWWLPWHSPKSRQEKKVYTQNRCW